MLDLVVDEHTVVTAEGSRQRPAMLLENDYRGWRVRFLGDYDALQQAAGEWLRLQAKLPDGDVPQDYIKRLANQGGSEFMPE